MDFDSLPNRQKGYYTDTTLVAFSFVNINQGIPTERFQAGPIPQPPGRKAVPLL
jgi:hypothetical protein